jgi:HK97 family phage major capsid protein
MPSLLDTITADRDRLAAERSALDGERRVLEADAEEAKSYDGVREPLSALDDKITGLDRQISGLDRDIAREQARRERLRQAPPSDREVRESDDALAAAEAGLRRQRPRALSEQFLQSDEWTGYAKAVAPRGHFSDKARVESPAVSIDGSILSRKGLISSGDTSAGAFIQNDLTGIFDEGAFQREITILDIIRRGTTDSDVVEYVRQTGFTNNAAVVAEADSVDPTDDTGRKPWSSLTLERVVETVATIAHGEAATLRSLSDAGQMRSLIDSYLRYGLLEELEDQVLNGDNSGDNFDGILHVTGTNVQVPAVDLATTIRKAKTKVSLLGKARANAVVLHPLDWETLDLWMTFEGPGSNYRQAAQQTAPTIWGLTVVESEAIDEGTALVGDFRYAMLWDREQTTVRATQGYEDFFMKNLVAILAEMRAAFGVIRPKAFTKADVSSFAS